MFLVVIHKLRHGLSGGGQRFCDGNTKAFVLKSVTIKEGVLRLMPDAIFGRPFTVFKYTPVH